MYYISFTNSSSFLLLFLKLTFDKIPEEIATAPELAANQVTELSASARSFLLSLAQIAYNESQPPIAPDSDSSSEVEDSLTWDALKVVLSVLATDTDTQDPWSDPPSFKVINNANSLFYAFHSILCGIF